MLEDDLKKTVESKPDSQHYSAMDSTYSHSASSTIDGKLKPVSTKKRVQKTKTIQNTISNDSSAKTSPTKDSASKRQNKATLKSPNPELTDVQSTPESKPSVVRDLFSLVIRRTRQTFRNNWNAKLASLILAILVWSIISANEQTIRQLTVSVPLTVLGQPLVDEAYPIPKNVEVKLSGPNSRLDDLKLRDLTATLDLRNISGDYQTRVRVTRPRGINIESYDPQIVAGRVE